MRAVVKVSSLFAKSTDFLSREDEIELINRWKQHGDERALERVIVAHIPLVRKLTRPFIRPGLSPDDLVSEGIVGLVNSIRLFDTSRGFRLSTLAIFHIREAIRSFALRNWSIVRNSSTINQKALLFGLTRALADIEREHGRSLLRRELAERVAERLHVSVDDAEVMIARRTSPDSSMEATTTEGQGPRLIDVLADASRSPEEVMVEQTSLEQTAATVREALSSLSARERTIVEARHMNGDRAMTLDALGATFGVSKERIRQIEVSAMKKLRLQLQPS